MAVALLAGAAAWQPTLLAPAARAPRARLPAVRLGFLDDFMTKAADSLLGEAADGVSDGSAAAFQAESEVNAQWAERRAADGFDGRALRKLIVDKWGKEHDVELTQTDYLGKSNIYLNVFPWTSDSTPWRHANQQDYLEHLQAVTELLVRWERCATVKKQIAETDKVPRRGTIPLKTVPIRLDLPNELARSFRA